jgi:hypothetical protein
MPISPPASIGTGIEHVSGAGVPDGAMVCATAATAKARASNSDLLIFRASFLILSALVFSDYKTFQQEEEYMVNSIQKRWLNMPYLQWVLPVVAGTK